MLESKYAHSAMPVPRRPASMAGHRDHLSCLLGLSLFLLFALPPLLAKGPEPLLRIPLGPLGFQPLSTQFLVSGSSLFTLHYVDDHHLLLTFTVRRLLPRLPEEPEDDQDRNVDALLLELPTGRVVARTSWRLHDHGQYLWSLGHGAFLLRIRDHLTTFAPLANLSTDEPFRASPFLATSGRRIAALFLSPDASLLLAETVERTPPVARPKTPLFGPAPPPRPAPEATDPNRVQINFYRLSPPADPGGPIQPRAAGVVRSSTPGYIASTAAGYLAIVDEGRQHWAFDFNSYGGKAKQLSPFDSTCRPSPFFVSRSEFVAFGCRTGNTRQLLGGFNMRGEEMWEQNLFGDYLAPTMVFAPASGRFAFSRILVRSSAVADQPLSSDELISQSIVVYQTNSGRQILHVECSPIERAGQNFTLSPDGLGLALIHADAIEVYGLPALTSKEESDRKLTEASAPEENDIPAHFAVAETPASVPQPGSAAPESPGPESTQPGSTGSAASSSAVTGATSQEPVSNTPGGDVSPGQPRKPPSLYTLPTDPPHTPTSDQPR